VILVLCLIVVLAMVSVISMSGWRQEVAFGEGVSRFSSALRLARAEAANLGLRLRLAMDANGGVQILYEPRPLESPGEFVEYVGCTWRDIVASGMVCVNRCERTGSSAYRPAGQGLSASPQGDGAVLDSLTFYPDGTSDSALVGLRPPDDADSRRAVLCLTGMDGAITTWMVDADSLADTYDQIHLEEYPNDTEGG
jgi:hypothetical protein